MMYQGRGEYSGIQIYEELQGYSAFITAAELRRVKACENGKMGRYHVTGDRRVYEPWGPLAGPLYADLGQPDAKLHVPSEPGSGPTPAQSQHTAAIGCPQPVGLTMIHSLQGGTVLMPQPPKDIRTLIVHRCHISHHPYTRVLTPQPQCCLHQPMPAEAALGLSPSKKCTCQPSVYSLYSGPQGRFLRDLQGLQLLNLPMDPPSVPPTFSPLTEINVFCEFVDISLQLASGIYNFACSLWNHHTDTFLQQVSSGNEAAVLSSLERTLLSLKVLRKLTVNGFVEPHKNMEVMGFLHGIFDRLKQFLECSRSIGTDNVCRDRLEKTIILFTKVLLDFLDQHPFSFTPLIQRSLEFSVSYVFTEVGEGVTFERFIVQCMNLIKMIVKNYAYKPSKNFEDSSPETLEAHKIKMAFFTYPTLTEICRRLVSHYFLLTEEELTMWEEDPEGFTVEETGGDSWKYSLRPCTEVLFIDIFHEYNQTLTPVLLEMMQTLQGPTNVEDMNALLIKDAVYNAVGLAAYELFDSVDFDQWFKNQLLPELQVIHNRYKPLRRRVIWLIGQWISVKFKSDLRPMLYEAICNLLQDQDLVVRIETATTLKLTVDDFEFRTDQFLPYLETMFTLLFQLLQQVTECDTKMHVLHVLSCVIERVNIQIRPYVGCLVQYLPLLWKQSEEHNMLRCAILTTLIHLVQGLGADSKNLYPFLLPVIQLSTDVSQPPHVYLLEDGLELWLVTLENSPCVTPELLRIFQNMSPLLELSSENLRTCFKIINGYIFLSSTEFLQTYAVGLCQSFCELLKEITTEGQVQVLKVVENALKVNPVLGPQMFQPILPCVFRGIIEGERYPVVMSTYLGVMGRVLLQNTSFFSSLLNEMAHKFNQEMDQLLGNMIEMWVDRMDNITQPERRKLSALALLSLLPSDNSVIQDKFCGIINISVEGLHDVMTEDPETGTYKDCMLMSHLEEPKVTEDEEPPTEQDKRKKMLALKDPVHTVSLQQFIYEKLKAQQELLGEQGFQSLMETVDTEIVTQLQEFLQGF
ncbi:importin-11 [Panthera uncia]|nr:importin-11 [Panthera uncia]